MPNIQSAKKRVKVTAKKTLRNRMVKSSVRTSIKKLNAAIASDPKNAAVQLSETTSALDKAVEENLIFRNPSDGCKLPSAKPREMKVLMPEEIQRLLIQAREGLL